MPRKRLTDAFVRSAKPLNGKLTEYADDKENGLCLRVTPSGAKGWTYRYRNKNRQQRRLSLGKVADVSLAQARAKVVQHRASVRNGGDPVLDLKLQRQDEDGRRGRETVQEIGDVYFEACRHGTHKRSRAPRPKRDSTIELQRSYFDRIIAPAFGRHNLRDLDRHTIQKFVDNAQTNHSDSAAQQCHKILHALFNYAVWQELADKNESAQVISPGYKIRTRVLTDEEMRTVWRTLSEEEQIGPGISQGVRLAIKLALVTLQRRSEVTGMRVNELDLDRRVWTIPGERTKNHRTQVVPLSDLAVELIREAMTMRLDESPYVFPSPRDHQKPIRPHAMTRAYGRMRDALGLADMRPHDLRRTASTILTSEALRVSRFIVSQVLNHASDSGNAAKVTGIYDQNDYLPEKRQALDAWATRLQEIVTGADSPGNVVPLRS